MATFGPANPHPLSTLRTELVWDGKYDEFGNRREIDAASLSMPLQRIETVDEPRARAEAQGGLFDTRKAHLDDFRNMLIWGDNKLVIASLLRDLRGQVDLIYIDPPFDVGADFTNSIQVYGTTRPDIGILSLGTSGSLVAGQNFTVVYELINLGDTDTGFFTVRINVDGVQQDIGELPVSARAKTGSISRLISGTALGSGSHTIALTVDVYNEVKESAPGYIQETNNTRSVNKTWVDPPRPDLAVQSITVTRAAPQPGDTVLVKTVIKNNGPADAGPFSVGFYRDRVSAPSVNTAPNASVPKTQLLVGDTTSGIPRLSLTPD